MGGLLLLLSAWRNAAETLERQATKEVEELKQCMRARNASMLWTHAAIVASKTHSCTRVVTNA
eukprot:4868965-Amphidinium_carterae.1